MGKDTAYEANAAVDENGAVEAADLVQIRNYVLGRITESIPYAE